MILAMLLALQGDFLVREDDHILTLDSNDRFRVVILSADITPANRAVYLKHAEAILAAAQVASDKIYGEFGYKVGHWLKPVFDPGAKGKLTITIKELGSDVYGSAGHTPRYDGWVPRLDVNHPDRFGPDKLVEDAVTHEFFHLVQEGYEIEEELWIKEATVSSLVDLVRPDHAGKASFSLCRRIPHWYASGNHPLDWCPKTDGGFDRTHAYAAGLFFQHLVEKHGRDILLRIWEHCAKLRPYDAIEAALKERGTTLAEAFQEFANAALFKTFDARYQDVLAPLEFWKSGSSKTANVPPAWPVEREGNRVTLRHGELTIEPLSALYFRCVLPEDFDPANLGVIVDGPAEIRFAFHVRRADGSWHRDGWKTAGLVQLHPMDPKADRDAVCVIVNTSREKKADFRVAFYFHPVPAITSVQVSKGGEAFYRATLGQERWERKEPDEPVEIRAGETVEVIVETSFALKSLRAILQTGHAEFRALETHGRKWGATIPHDRIAAELKRGTRVVLKFVGESRIGLGLDGDPLTRTRLQGSEITGWEKEPDATHAVRLKLEGQTSDSSGCLCGEIAKPEGDFVVARIEGKLWVENERGDKHEWLPPAGIALHPGTGSPRIEYDEKRGGMLFRVEASVAKDYPVQVYAFHPDPKSAGKYWATVQQVTATMESPFACLIPGWGRLHLGGPAAFKNGSISGRGGAKSERTGTLRFTQFGPAIFEGHAKALAEWNWDHVNSRDEVDGHARGKATIEICFRSTVKNREEQSGDLERRLDELEKKQRGELTARIRQMEKDYKARRDPDNAELKKLGEEMKDKSKRAKAGEIPTSEALEAVARVQEFAKKIEKDERDHKASVGETRKSGEAAIESRVKDAREEAWRLFLETMPKAPWTAKP